MKKSVINGHEVPYIGMGTMRFPLKDIWNEESVDYDKVQELVDTAMANGINYFDTAYDYSWSESEKSLSMALRKYPRDSYYFTTKCPCCDFEHYDSPTNPDELLQKQFKRTGLDYFDFYLMHGLRDTNIGWFIENANWFFKQKEIGKIRSIGVSCHCSPNTLDNFLNLFFSELDFVQITINWYEWFNEDSHKLYEICCKYNMPVIAMIPLKAGRLVHLTDNESSYLNSVNSNYSQLQWAYNFINTVGKDNVKMILTGMTSVESINENSKVIKQLKNLTDKEIESLRLCSSLIKEGLNCAKCYCCVNNCPQKLDIPEIINAYNQNIFHRGKNHGLDLWRSFNINDGDFPEKFEFNNCLECKQCELVCPNKINISKIMSEMKEMGQNELCDYYW